MKSLFATCLLVGLLILPAAATAQDIVRYEGTESLAARWSWAMDEADDGQTTSGFWVGYSFSRRMCEQCYSGTYYDTDWDGMPTLAELISNTRVDEDFRTIRDAARRTLNELNGDGPTVAKDVAILFEFERDGSSPLDLEMSNMSLAFDLGARPIIWLGKANDSESIALLRSVYESASEIEARKGAVWAIGMHDAPDLAIPFLSGVLSSNVATEIRKSAAYGLGNQNDERALRLLRSTALSDRDPDVSKASVYALGNIGLPGATTTLREIIERTGLSLDVRKAALYSLGNRDERAALTTLRGVALDDHPAELQKAATYAIGNMDIDGAVEALADILRSAPEVDVQKAALYAIGNTDGASGVKFLMETALSSRSDELAKAAVYALGNAMEDNDISPLLEVLRKSKSIDVRKAAVYSVGNVDGPAALEALKYVLENETNTDVRKAAVHALGNIDSDEARNMLMAIISDVG